ncbi:MAG TPA: zinc-binding dehydrogenase [Alphaproteobacteria bacterium]|jgi:threonine dehydrogenase-like Zn-dependent dehydrogenase
MPPSTQRILMLEAPRQVRFVERALPRAGPGDVVVRSLYSSFKHGTEIMAYSGRSPFATRAFDPRLRLFEPAGSARNFYPRPMGSMVVGTVAAVGSDVRSVQAGQLVYAWAPVADVHVTAAEKVKALGALTPHQALCIDPAAFALGALYDGAIGSGDTVLVTGLGAIGLFAVQYCRARGATVLAASGFAPRRALAKEYGARAVYDPKAHEDLARHIKEQVGGADAAIECSGNLATLNLAIRAARQCGRVVCVGFYGPADARLNLGEEFFHNRISLLASLPALSWDNPVRGEHPLRAKDLQELAARDLAAGTIVPEGILAPTVSFAEAGRAVEMIAAEPERVIKVLVKHD